MKALGNGASGRAEGKHRRNKHEQQKSAHKVLVITLVTLARVTQKGR